MTRKKPSKKKAKKKIVLDKKGDTEPEIRILAQVELTPAVVEILKSNEAKLYLTGIERSFKKLQTMIRREGVLAQHPGHAKT